MSKLHYTVDFLNVGFGLSVVAYPTRERFPVLVVDGGYDQPEKYTDLALPLVEHLSRLGVKEVDLMVATHPHRDHIGGLARVVEHVPVRRFLTGFPSPPPLAGDHWNQSNMAAALQLYATMVEELHRQNAHVIGVTGTTCIRCGRAELTICPPASAAIASREEKLLQCQKAPSLETLKGLSNTLNETSLMVRIRINQVSFLLPADRNLATLSGWERIVSPAEVLLIPHHGDASYLSQEAVEAIGAKTAVVSADTRDTYGLPSPGLEKALKSWGVEQVLYTTGSPHKETTSGIRFLIGDDGAVEQQWIG